MSPDSRSRRKQSTRRPAVPQVRVRPSSDDAHDVAFFRRHGDDDAGRTAPGREFLNACPVKVRATMRAVLTQVAAAPPKRFAGGGYWEAMKGDMTGWFEVRVDGPAATTTDGAEGSRRASRRALARPRLPVRHRRRAVRLNQAAFPYRKQSLHHQQPPRCAWQCHACASQSWIGSA
jgi:hypothetical protein